MAFLWSAFTCFDYAFITQKLKSSAPLSSYWSPFLSIFSLFLWSRSKFLMILIATKFIHAINSQIFMSCFSSHMISVFGRIQALNLKWVMLTCLVIYFSLLVSWNWSDFNYYLKIKAPSVAAVDYVCGVDLSGTGIATYRAVAASLWSTGITKESVLDNERGPTQVPSVLVDLKLAVPNISGDTIMSV